MNLRPNQFQSASLSGEASRAVPARYPIRFEMRDNRPSLGERIIAAARVAAAMHLTEAVLISADEAAILALESTEAPA